LTFLKKYKPYFKKKTLFIETDVVKLKRHSQESTMDVDRGTVLGKAGTFPST
jgi:hypothetical protein